MKQKHTVTQVLSRKILGSRQSTLHIKISSEKHKKKYVKYYFDNILLRSECKGKMYVE